MSVFNALNAGIYTTLAAGTALTGALAVQQFITSKRRRRQPCLMSCSVTRAAGMTISRKAA